MKKQYLVAMLNALLIPLALLSGVALEQKNYFALSVMLTVCIIVEFYNTVLWFEINKEIHTK